MSHAIFEQLRTYLNDNEANFNALNTQSLSNEEKILLVYEIYANFLDLEEDSKAIRGDMRIRFGIKDAVVKKWIRDEENKADADTSNDTKMSE